MSINSIIPKPIAEYDLRLLRIFVSVVEHGGFSAAEKALGITRSTISVHMSNLETRMKLKLCMRGRGGFALTEEGQLVYRAVISLFDSLNDFSLMVGTLGKELSGEIVILCADQLDVNKQNKLARTIEIIHEKAPNLHITLDTLKEEARQNYAGQAHPPQFRRGKNNPARSKQPLTLPTEKKTAPAPCTTNTLSSSTANAKTGKGQTRPAKCTKHKKKKKKKKKKRKRR